MLKKYFSYFTLGLLIAVISPVSADQYHYVNLLVGDRASGMGGAYAAISDDASGLFYNPAGVVYAPSSNLSASMNAYHITRTQYKNVLKGDDWVRSSEALLPNYFGVIQPLGKGVLGFSYAVIDAALEDQDQVFSGVPTPDATFTINFNNQDNTYLVGPSYAQKLGKSLSIGVTLYGFTRNQERIFNQIFENVYEDTYAETGDLWENEYYHVSEYGIKPVLGIMYSPVNRVSIGITAAQTFIVHSTRERYVNCTTNLTKYASAESCPNASVISNSYQIAGNRQLPWEIRGGFAWFATERIILSGDVMAYRPMYTGLLPTINAAAGSEIYLTPTLALRLGAYSNFANTPQPVEGYTSQPEHVDLYGGSISLTNFTRSSAITIGVNAGYGQGKAQVVASSPSVQEVVTYQLTGYMSASYSY